MDNTTIAALRAIPWRSPELSLGRRARVESGGGPVELIALEMAGPGYGAFRFVEGDPGEAWPRVDRGDAVPRERAAGRGIGGSGLGDSVTLLTANGPRAVPRRRGPTATYASDRGEILMSRRGYVAAWGDPTVTGVGVYLAPGGDTGRGDGGGARSACRRRARSWCARTARSAKRPAGGLRPYVRDQPRCLRALAMAVAFVGMLSALTAIQLERAREVGVLRALGLGRAQLFAHVELQTAVMGAIAGPARDTHRLGDGVGCWSR